MSPRTLWLRLGGVWFAGAGLLVLAHPHPVAVAWPDREAAATGIVGGIILYLLVSGRCRVTPAAAAVLAVAAAAEEVVWRWFALGELAHLAGTPVALASTALGFGAVHRHGRLQHIATGLAFGTVYVVTGSLVGAWCAHVTYNLAVAGTVRTPPAPA